MSIVIKQIKRFDSKLLNELIELNNGVHTPNRKFFGDKKNLLLIAYDNRKIAGFLFAYLLIHPDRPQPAIFLYSIDVFESFRQKGIATRLIVQLKKMARKLHCFEIFVFTEQGNRAAIKLYSKTGGLREKINDVMFVYPIK